MTAKIIRFKTEDGIEWSTGDFAAYHQMTVPTIRTRWYRLGSPSDLQYSDLLRPARSSGGQNALTITVILRDCSERVCSASEMSKLVNEAQGYHCAVASHYERWVRMGKPNPVHVDRLVRRQKAREKNDLSHIPAGDLAYLSGRMDRNREEFLAIIPGPSRLEKKYLDNSGQFGGSSVKRENFAGCNAAGFPIYTGGF